MLARQRLPWMHEKIDRGLEAWRYRCPAEAAAGDPYHHVHRSADGNNWLCAVIPEADGLRVYTMMWWQLKRQVDAIQVVPEGRAFHFYGHLFSQYGARLTKVRDVIVNLHAYFQHNHTLKMKHLDNAQGPLGRGGRGAAGAGAGHGERAAPDQLQDLHTARPTEQTQGRAARYAAGTYRRPATAQPQCRFARVACGVGEEYATSRRLAAPMVTVLKASTSTWPTWFTPTARRARHAAPSLCFDKVGLADLGIRISGVAEEYIRLINLKSDDSNFPNECLHSRYGNSGYRSIRRKR